MDLSTLSLWAKIALGIGSLYGLFIIAVMVRHVWKHKIKGEPFEPHPFDDQPPM